MIKRLSITVFIALFVVGLTVVGLAKYQRSIPQAIARGLSAAVDDRGIASVEENTLVAAAKALPAPALSEGDWINSEATTLEKLRGRVVVLEFWTFGCYNCRNTLPAVKEWDSRYREHGLTIVGVHTPETDSEYKLDNVRRGVASLDIKYPVVTDNDYKTWNAYGVEAWPTIFVLDKQGRVRWKHVGEGRYDETEKVIRALLAE